LKMAIN